MRIHTDKLDQASILQHTPPNTYVEVTRHGSRKRDHAFEVGISAAHGTDVHGIKRAYARNTGKYGGSSDFDRAATWVEWGDYIVALFKIDPNAIVGYYDGWIDFVTTTKRYAEHRPKRENAPEHVERWRQELVEAESLREAV